MNLPEIEDLSSSKLSRGVGGLATSVRIQTVVLSAIKANICNEIGLPSTKATGTNIIHGADVSIITAQRVRL